MATCLSLLVRIQVKIITEVNRLMEFLWLCLSIYLSIIYCMKCVVDEYNLAFGISYIVFC